MLAASPAVLVAVCALLGLLIGSFLNVVILRLPARLQRDWEIQSREILGLEPQAGPSEVASLSVAAAVAPDPATGAGVPQALETTWGNAPPDIVFARSACPRCGHRLSAWENIPLLSFALLRGRCRACREPISWQYPLVETATAVVFALCAWRFGFAPALGVALLVGAALVALSGIDLRTQLLPDQITLPLLWFALLASVAGWTIAPAQAILGAAIGYLSLWSVYWLFKLMTGKEGMGYGDFKLLAALGALVGAKGILPIVLIASFVGAIVGVAQIVFQGRDRATPIPFGPYLAAAGFIQILFGKALLSAWNAWFGLG
ncbi:MAG: A24 family peptidase [Lysobacterales bacterium]